jgi:hypothetical protein
MFPHRNDEVVLQKVMLKRGAFHYNLFLLVMHKVKGSLSTVIGGRVEAWEIGLGAIFCGQLLDDKAHTTPII